MSTAPVSKATPQGRRRGGGEGRFNRDVALLTSLQCPPLQCQKLLHREGGGGRFNRDVALLTSLQCPPLQCQKLLHREGGGGGEGLTVT